MYILRVVLESWQVKWLSDSHNQYESESEPVSVRVWTQMVSSLFTVGLRVSTEVSSKIVLFLFSTEIRKGEGDDGNEATRCYSQNWTQAKCLSISACIESTRFLPSAENQAYYDDINLLQWINTLFLLLGYVKDLSDIIKLLTKNNVTLCKCSLTINQ